MVTTKQPKIYKVILLPLFALCLGVSSQLYATQDDEVEEEKDAFLAHRDVRPNYDNNGTRWEIPLRRRKWDKKRVNWGCKSIQSCKAFVTIMDCLQYWQTVTNDIKQLEQVSKDLSSFNNYRDIVGAYHHLLEKHLNGKHNKEAFRFINGRVQQYITCDFAKCKGYDRNQRDRGNEAVEKDEIEKYGKKFIFIRDILDTIHAYLVHGSDSGHRYSPSKQKQPKDECADEKKQDEAELTFIDNTLDTIHAYLGHRSGAGHRYSLSNYKAHKMQKQPKDECVDEKEPDAATASYILFDKEIAKLRERQKSIRQQGRNQKKNKFSTVVNEGPKITLALLQEKFGEQLAFIKWMHYVKDNECDTDCLLEEINMHNEGKTTVIPIDDVLFDNVKKYIQENPTDGKKTAIDSFGVRLYYWDRYRYDKAKDDWLPQYDRYELYVPPFHPSLKNEILAKKYISVSNWDQKMYAAKQMLAQSATLSKLKAVANSDFMPRGYRTEFYEGVSVRHLLAIMFYTDFTALCTAFRKSLRYGFPSEKLKDLIRRNSKWYYLSRYLREVVERFGTEIGGGTTINKEATKWVYDPYNIKGDTYYHGVSYLLFGQLSLHWYSPLSTSKQMEVATLFTTSTNNGLLLELKEDHQSLRFFNVSLLSCFGAEDERLFIGGRHPIQVASIHLLKDNTNLKQIMHTLFIVHAIISGKSADSNGGALPSDLAIYKDLLTKAPARLPIYAQHIWNTFRQQQQHITINIAYMYQYYQAFKDLLFDAKINNLLLLDTIVQLFPNVAEIICRYTDCIGINKGKRSWYDSDYEYSSAIISSNFMLGVKDCLSKMNKHAKLTRIVMLTMEPIEDSCKLYTTEFGKLGWQVEKGSSLYQNKGESENDQITLTKLAGPIKSSKKDKKCIVM